MIWEALEGFGSTLIGLADLESGAACFPAADLVNLGEDGWAAALAAPERTLGLTGVSKVSTPIRAGREKF